MRVVKRACAAIAVAAAVASWAGPAGANPSLFFGFADDGAKWTDSTWAAPAKDLGAKSFRVSLQWSPGQTSVDATGVAQLKNALSVTGGMKIILAVWGARAIYAPQDATAREQYCSYVRSAVSQVPQINDVVVWNEPNLSGFWQPQFNLDGTSAAPGAYEALLARCYDVLHAFRSTINVIGPATSPAGNDAPNATSNISHSPQKFILKMGDAYRASGRTQQILDTVSQHAYGTTPVERPWKRHTGTRIGEGDYDKLVAAYRTAFGGTAQRAPGECLRYRCVEVWWLEHGWQTSVDAAKASLYTNTENVVVLPDYAGGEPLLPAPSADSPAPDQATQALDAVRLAYCQPYSGAIFNFLLRDEPDLKRWQSGVLWFDGTQKDSYPYFKQVVAEANTRAVNCSQLKGGAATASPDLVAPVAPSGLTMTKSFFTGAVTLRWLDASERDVAGFNVYRSTNYGASWTKRNSTVVKQASYSDSATFGPVSYYVTAVDTSANESGPSNKVP